MASGKCSQLGGRYILQSCKTPDWDGDCPGAFQVSSGYNPLNFKPVLSMTSSRLEAEILKLPRSVRARLAERLISSLDEGNEIEQVWAAEADRRYRACEGGDEKMSPLEDVLAAIREEFNLCGPVVRCQR